MPVPVIKTSLEIDQKISEELEDFVACAICGLATFIDSEQGLPPRDYDLVPGTPFCFGCSETFEAKVWMAAQK